MASSKDKAVATAQQDNDPSKALVANAAYADFAGQGFEHQSSDDYSIPFITVLQGLSPQLQDNDALKQGMIFNTVTGEAFSGKDGIAFVPASTRHEFIEFKPREAGGGFVGRHEINSEVVADAKAKSVEYGKYHTPEGNELIETFAVYGVVIDGDGNTVDAVIAFSGTKIKKYKAWMTKAKTIQLDIGGGRRISAPLFSHRYRLKTVSEKNAKGSYYNWDIAFDGENAVAARLSPDDPLFQQAYHLKGLLDSGAARANYEAGAASSTSGDAEGGAPAGKPAF